MGTRTRKTGDEDDDECVNVGNVFMGDLLNDDILEHEGKKKGRFRPRHAPVNRGAIPSSSGTFDCRCCRKIKSQIAGGRGCELIRQSKIIGWKMQKVVPPDNKINLNDATSASTDPSVFRATKIEDFDVR